MTEPEILSWTRTRLTQTGAGPSLMFELLLSWGVARASAHSQHALTIQTLSRNWKTTGQSFSSSAFNFLCTSCYCPATVRPLSCTCPATVLLLSCCCPAAVLQPSCCRPAAVLLLSCCCLAASFLQPCAVKNNVQVMQDSGWGTLQDTVLQASCKDLTQIARPAGQAVLRPSCKTLQ